MIYTIAPPNIEMGGLECQAANGTIDFVYCTRAYFNKALRELFDQKTLKYWINFHHLPTDKVKGNEQYGTEVGMLYENCTIVSWSHDNPVTVGFKVGIQRLFIPLDEIVEFQFFLRR